MQDTLTGQETHAVAMQEGQDAAGVAERAQAMAAAMAWALSATPAASWPSCMATAWVSCPVRVSCMAPRRCSEEGTPKRRSRWLRTLERMAPMLYLKLGLLFKARL